METTNETTNEKPQALTGTLAAELAAELAARIRRAADPCPEEFRPAYIHLLETEWKNADSIRKDCELNERQLTQVCFQRAILGLLLHCPEVDPWELGNMAEDLAPLMPMQDVLGQFAERLRTLAELRQRE